MNTDAAVPGLNRSNVYRLLVPWAPDDVRLAFDDLASPLRRTMQANSNEARTLAATRDVLLPKLMSGEIRLRDADKIVQAVA
jgi:type I restriction enzyme S subunit